VAAAVPLAGGEASGGRSVGQPAAAPSGWKRWIVIARERAGGEAMPPITTSPVAWPPGASSVWD